MKPTLNDESKRSLEKMFGVSITEISRMDIDDLDKLVEKKIKKKLTFQTKFKNLISRGSIYLFFERLLGIDEVNKKLSKI
jgi:hypothetical protein